MRQKNRELKVMKLKKKNKQISCPYCGRKAVLKPGSYLFGDDAAIKHLYVCSGYPACDAYVRAHDHSLEPMGSLANDVLRKLRMQAHAAFDDIWRRGIMNRRDAYRWLQDTLCLSRDQAHIGQFSDYMCQQVIRNSRKVLTNNKQRRKARRAA